MLHSLIRMNDCTVCFVNALVSMLKVLEKAQGISLTDSDIKEFTKGKCNVLAYPELQRATTLDQVLGAHGAACILFETKQESPTVAYGHWTAVIRTTPDLVEWFDSYSLRYMTHVVILSNSVLGRMPNWILSMNASRPSPINRDSCKN